MTEDKNINTEGTGRKEEPVSVTASNKEHIKEKSGETTVIPTLGKPRLTKPHKEEGRMYPDTNKTKKGNTIPFLGNQRRGQ